MADFMDFMNQTGMPVVIVLSSLLLLLFLILVYSALIISSHADEQSEREWNAWRQNHPDQGECLKGAAYE